MALTVVPVRADYADLVTFFSSLQDTVDAAIFPVLERTTDDIESAFGPRIQSSTDNYDWHRGIDVDGTLNSDTVVAPLKGYFYDYRYTASGGNIVILEHHFADFNNGSVTSVNYGGKTLTKFYTWHLHLYDDGVAANATGTDDIVSAFTVGHRRLSLMLHCAKSISARVCAESGARSALPEDRVIAALGLRPSHLEIVAAQVRARLNEVERQLRAEPIEAA